MVAREPHKLEVGSSNLLLTTIFGEVVLMEERLLCKQDDERSNRSLSICSGSPTAKDVRPSRRGLSPR